MAAHDPDLVMIQLGVNDVWGGTAPVAPILANYKTLVDQARAHNPNIVVMVAQIHKIITDDCTNTASTTKAQELVITYMIEAVMSKRRILEIYLNVAELGNGVFGAEAAARHHFGVPASRLEPGQAARLAAMLPRPRYYDANPRSAALARRSASIARWMASIDPP